MSQLMKRYLAVLDSVQHMSSTARRRFLANCPKDLLTCFSECALNILKGNVELSDEEYEVLRCRKEDIRQLASKKTPLVKKRRLLVKDELIEDILEPVLTLFHSSSKESDSQENYDEDDDDSQESYDKESRKSSKLLSPVEHPAASCGMEQYACPEVDCDARYRWLKSLRRHQRLKH